MIQGPKDPDRLYLHDARLAVAVDEARQLRHLAGGGAAAVLEAKVVEGADGLLRARPLVQLASETWAPAVDTVA